MDKNFVWLAWLVLMTLIAFLLIPRRQFFRLLPFGIVAGFLLSLAILLLNVPLLGIWAFNTVPANSMLGVPMTLPLVWIPVTMLFAFYVPQYHSRKMLLAWIAIFAAATTLVQGLAAGADIVRFIRWDLFATLLLTFGLFSLISLFVLRYGISPGSRENSDKYSVE